MDTTPPAHMAIQIGGEGDNFLVRRGTDRTPPPCPFPVVGTRPRLVLSLVHGAELDHLLYAAFDCDDTEDTFRGQLREAVERTKPDVLTSLCGYRIGFEGESSETAELTLLATVFPGSLSPSEAITLVPKLEAVLKSYDERLGNIAIEIAEQAIVLAASGTNQPSRTDPADGNDEISYQASPLPGASIGLKGNIKNAGTLGAFFAITVGCAPTRYFGMTCSHVLSSDKAPIVHGQKGPCVVCPSDKDNFHWWNAALNASRFTDATPAELQEAEAHKVRAANFQRTVSTMYASSGLRSSLEGHWLLDWALIALHPERFQTFENLNNAPSETDRRRFKKAIVPHLTTRDVQEVDWTPRGTRRYVAPSDLTEDVREHVRVFKVGRTTGCTTGYLHKIDASVTVGHVMANLDGEEKAKTLVKGKAIVVLPNPNSGLFAERGDSGALVLNGHAEAVGVIIAVVNMSPTYGATYIAPLDPAIDHMRELVQRTVGTEKVEIELL